MLKGRVQRKKDSGTACIFLLSRYSRGEHCNHLQEMLLSDPALWLLLNVSKERFDSLVGSGFEISKY